MIQREPLGVIDPETRGLLASIGISKGTPFAPDERMRALLTEAAAVANGTARAIAFKTRDPEAYRYPDRRWKTAFIGNDYRWLRDDGVGGRNLDARTLFFYVATVNTPAMALQIPGVGSQYAYTEHDSRGEYLDGGQALPAHRPARRPGQGLLVGRRLRPPDPIRAPDRPAVPEQATTRATRWPRTPTARSPSPSDRPRPTSNPGNWIQTVPGKKWFTILRLYGPLEPWFDKTWIPATSNRSTPTNGKSKAVVRCDVGSAWDRQHDTSAAAGVDAIVRFGAALKRHRLGDRDRRAPSRAATVRSAVAWCLAAAGKSSLPSRRIVIFVEEHGPEVEVRPRIVRGVGGDHALVPATAASRSALSEKATSTMRSTPVGPSAGSRRQVRVIECHAVRAVPRVDLFKVAVRRTVPMTVAPPHACQLRGEAPTPPRTPWTSTVLPATDPSPKTARWAVIPGMPRHAPTVVADLVREVDGLLGRHDRQLRGRAEGAVGLRAVHPDATTDPAGVDARHRPAPRRPRRRCAG